MDPLPIAYGCVSLIAEATRLAMGIPIFVASNRAARKDMDALLRELTSLQLCLNALKDDDQSASLTYPQSLNRQINQLLTNTEVVVKQINYAIIKLPSRRVDEAIYWSSTDRRDIVRYRSILESNRLALDLTVTMGSIAKLLDQRKTVHDHRLALNQLSEATISAPGISVILEHGSDTSTEALQLGALKQEIGDFRSQFSDLSSPNVHENMQTFNSDALAYTKTMLEPFPDLHVELIGPKIESTLSPSTSVSTATSSSAFTKRSHSFSGSTTSAESKADDKFCLACAGPLVTHDQDTALRNFYEKQTQARSVWQKQLEKEQDEIACLQEEVARLQDANNTLQTGRQRDLDSRMNESLKEKDNLIKDLQQQFRASSFYISVRAKGLDKTIEAARKDFADWEKWASTLSRGRMVGDPSMSTGAPDEDGSDTTATEQPVRVPRRPLNQGSMSMDISPIHDIPQQVIFEFSVNFSRDDLILRILSGLDRALSRPVIIHCYKQWATVDAVIREILKLANEQNPPLILDNSAGPCYITKVSQRYDDAANKPLVDIEPLSSDQHVANLRILPGDKLRLMQGPLGFHLSADTNLNSHRQSFSSDRSTNEFRQNPVAHRSRAEISKLDENLPEVLNQRRSTNVSPISNTLSYIHSAPSISHVRSDSGGSYLQPDIVVSHTRSVSEFSGHSANTRISQPAGMYASSPIFEFRVDRANNQIRLKPRTLVTNHSNYYSRLGPPSSVHHDFMIGILKQTSVDPVHFTDDDAAGNMKHYITDLLTDLLTYWSYDLSRITLQIRSTMLHKSEPLRSYSLNDSASIWVMLKPYKPSDSSALGFSPSDTVPGDHEMWVEQVESSALQRLSFNDSNFRRIYAARKHARSASLATFRS